LRFATASSCDEQARPLERRSLVKVDRDRFLVLTAALATAIAPGCGTTNPPEEPAAPPPALPPAVVTVAPLPPPAAPPMVVAPAPPPPVAAAAPSRDVAVEPPDPYKGTPVTAQACDPALNRVGTPPSCKLAPPGPTCESFSDTKQECPTLTTLLKPRVAAAAIECLRRRSGTSAICEFNVTSICAYEALGRACHDPSAVAACDKVMARCGAGPRGNYNKMSRESCEAGVSGVADGKRAKFISCITETCRFETCLTYL
jgi:hypothetical protein